MKMIEKANALRTLVSREAPAMRLKKSANEKLKFAVSYKRDAIKFF